MKNFADLTYRIYSKVKAKKPLIHHITNFVVMNDTANLTLALGASPVMAHAKEEVEDMTTLSDALVLNVGTLTKEWIESMILSAKIANKKGIPVILDPVGAGATSFRTEMSFQILESCRVSILRGNNGEISTLAGFKTHVKGVDSLQGADPMQVVRDAALKFNCVVVVTGKEDVVSDGKRTVVISNGHELLTTITGSGCMVTTAIAVVSAVHTDLLESAVSALSIFGIAAEIAATKAKGPGSFKVYLFDHIHKLSQKEIEHRIKIREI